MKSVAKRSIPVKEVERVEENIKALVKAKKKVEAYIQTLPVEKQLPERMFLNTFDVETSNALKHQQQVSVAPEKKQPATRKIKFSSTQWKKPHRIDVMLVRRPINTTYHQRSCMPLWKQSLALILWPNPPSLPLV
ncbi:hypothetical protein [Psychrosphaera algicola]|uniref:Uncharacterized protein n=1 Tax=Psychrosphaera algicola TaxID=3023714 RepID=A0ABT5FGB3_9GAMM|nr:hypothetical protein [Psychrosphaera sp. G1-22]MDC2889716.1 hypothetical protein [Psychrosphaera sp. G1-22]